MTRRRAMSGQSLVEFALCCGVMVIALLVPWNGGASVMTQLARALGTWFRVLTFLLSIS